MEHLGHTITALPLTGAGSLWQNHCPWSFRGQSLHRGTRQFRSKRLRSAPAFGQIHEASFLGKKWSSERWRRLENLGLQDSFFSVPHTSGVSLLCIIWRGHWLDHLHTRPYPLWSCPALQSLGERRKNCKTVFSLQGRATLLIGNHLPSFLGAERSQYIGLRLWAFMKKLRVPENVISAANLLLIKDSCSYWAVKWSGYRLGISLFPIIDVSGETQFSAWDHPWKVHKTSEIYKKSK